MAGKKKLLLLTDLNYKAKARAFYGAEDVFLSEQLRKEFDVAICDLPSAKSFEDNADIIVVRNIGAISFFRDEYEDFKRRVNEKHLNIFNQFNGIGDQSGKQYLLDLYNEGYGVIPTVDRISNIVCLGDVNKYCIKPKNGADSNGLEYLTREELLQKKSIDGEYVIQPWIDFLYEVSFYFIDDKFEYAMYTPDKTKRWELQVYDCSEEDISYAKEFIKRSPIKKGIQRIDACRNKTGELLLMELEDLDPYLSLDLLPEDIRERFVSDMIASLKTMVKM